MRAPVFLLVCGLLAMCMSPAAAQTALFVDDAPLQLALEGPLARLVAHAPDSLDPYPATLRLERAGGAQNFPIQINPRGVARRVGGICSFPPLAIAFDRSTVAGTVFQGQSRLKLVNACKPGAAYEQYLVREYTAYRLYNLITPMSFRVRPTQMTYHDTDGRRGDRTRFAFLIESTDDLARRNGRAELEVRVNTVDYSRLDPRMTTVYALFQYMIGNLDWDFTSGRPDEHCCHNNKLLAREGAVADLVSVPYDFDYSGFVDTPYARPPENVPVSSVRARFYRGLCRFRDELPGAMALFQSKRADILALIAAETRLTADSRRAAAAYIEPFFAVLDDTVRAQHEFTGRCPP